MENLVKSKIRTFYPDADFSSTTSEDLIVLQQLIQERLTKLKFNDNIAHVKVNKKEFGFDKTKEPYLGLQVKFHNKDNALLNNIDLNCYAFDVKVQNEKNEDLYNILLNSWRKLMITKFKREYCDELSNYILAWRARSGDGVAHIATKMLKDVMIEKYSITKEETNQP